MTWVNVERPFAQVVSDTAVSVEGVIRLKHSRSTETDTFRFILRPRQDALELATSLRQDSVYRERDGLEVLGYHSDDTRRSTSGEVEIPMHSPDYFEVRAKIESEFKSAMTEPLKTRDITVERWTTRPLNRKRLGEAVAALTRRVIERGGTADLVRLEARQTSAWGRSPVIADRHSDITATRVEMSVRVMQTALQPERDCGTSVLLLTDAEMYDDEG